ncbi:MAG: endonuclease/exonuclease/phosphatase family protein [Spirochaetales bacterium]|nr:endonuclease/exonuclease/phosphatase family protein [Spirochaetales bacterium]
MKVAPIVFTVVFSLFFSCRKDITVMSYNVQTLFDDVDDGTEYPAFDPGSGKWNSNLFAIKLQAVGKVIREACLNGPDILALQEVENGNTLTMLNTRVLKECGYTWKVLVPAPGSATNTAILSRYPILRTHAHHTGLPALRFILEVEISIDGRILYLFNNHWKSHTEGSRVTEPSRREAAYVLKQRVAVILERNPGAAIIVTGDFNENVDEYRERTFSYQTAFIPSDIDVPGDFHEKSVFLTPDTGEAGYSENRLVLYDLWYELPRTGWGSYAYNGRWYTFDHVLLTRGLCDGDGLDYRTGSFSVVKHSFLVDKHTGFPIKWDTSRKKGYSDHLPLLIKVGVAGNNE